MQFEDADEDALASPQPPLAAGQLPPTAAPALASSRAGATFVDDEAMPDDDEAEDDYGEYEDDEDEWDGDAGLDEGLLAVMDQDWADAAGDFTKRYNRMKQQVLVSHGQGSSGATKADGSSSSSSTNASSRPSGSVLPATNRARRAPVASSSRTNAGAGGPSKADKEAGVHLDKVTDQLAHYSRFASRIDLDPLWQAPTSGTATRKGGSEKVLVKDKSDRATNEQVLDPRTRLILFKMLGRGLIERIDGCVSTGKEANVYHAVGPPAEGAEVPQLVDVDSSAAPPAAADDEPEPSRTTAVRFAPDTAADDSTSAPLVDPSSQVKHIALKIFKTSILVFKDRDRYVTGEFRFKGGYARSNPRKMVRLWAEKELRNLRRMRSAGLRVPEAIEVRENVLVMDFLGQGGADEWQASPRLKDAQIPPEQNHALYIEILVILRAIFYRCRLVHADFSEYNILYHQGHLWVIDVSQSIEHEHPAAFDFLRSDLKNADDFFRKRGVDTLGLTRTFAFVTRDESLAASGSAADETDADAAREVERLLGLAADDAAREEREQAQAQARGEEEQQRPTASDEAVFAQAYIPRTLDQVYDAERDVEKVLRGEGKGLIYADITGVANIHLGGGGGGKKGDEEEEENEGEVVPAPAAKVKGGRAAAGEEEGGEGLERSGDESEGSEDGSSDDDEDGSGDDEDQERRPRGKKHEDKDDKKKRKQETKEKAREKRATKMKKSEKARRMKKSSGKR
ncbi:hypothetical protein JCM3775_005863 [Rhodotorula graminis]